MISLEELLNTNLWFDDTDDNLNFGSELKKVFFIMFQDGDHVQWRSIMAYLCRDTEPQVAFEKALTVLKGSISQNTEIRPEELLQVVYPCDIQKALNEGCSVLSLQDFKVLLKMAKEEVEEHDYLRTREDDEASNSTNHSTNHSTRPQMGSRMSEATRVSPIGTGIGIFPHSSQTNIPKDEQNGEKEEEWEGMSEFSEETAAVLEQFLASCYSPNIIHTSSSVHVSTKEEEEENKVTLQDILTSKCKGLHSILNARFDSNSILMFQ